MRVLVTGAAGFIGYHVAARLLARGDDVVGADSVNDYYSVQLKESRLARLTALPGFRFVRIDLAHRDETARLFEQEFDAVVHLAAQAGVRYSLSHPHAYVESNLVGFLHVLEGCRHRRVKHLVYASSSSVYGGNDKLPFSEEDNVDHPLSLYAATKKSNELMAHCYSHLYRIPTTGLRFFTVYGPWGRPDMALFLFTAAIFAGRPIPVFNNGEMSRDFTYIDDIVEGLVRLLDRPPAPAVPATGGARQLASSSAPYRIFNLGNDQPVELLRMIEVLEQCLGKRAEKTLLPMQPGDVPATWADVARLHQAVGDLPQTQIEEGVRRFVEWYREYYRV